jgi:hypothetical protein
VAGGETQLKSVVQFVQAVKGVLHKVTQEPPSIGVSSSLRSSIISLTVCALFMLFSQRQHCC